MNEPKYADQFKHTGPKHIWAAFTYSLAGLKRLLRESACRHVLVFYAMFIGLFYFIGAQWWSYLGLTAILFVVEAFEALNTAIEEIVDHVSPEYSDMAKHAKDLGSLAVMFILLIGVCWVAFVVTTLYV